MKTSLPLRIEQNLEAHIRVASRIKEQAAIHGDRPAPFITLSRQFGCEAIALGEILIQRLDAAEKLESGSWQLYSRKLIESMADQEYSFEQLMAAVDSKARGAIEEFVETLVGQISDLKLLHKLVRTMRATAMLGRCIIVGRGGALLTRDLPGGIHVRLVAPEEFRLKGLVDRLGWTEAEARKEIHERDFHRIGFFQKYLHRDSNDPENYDLVLNTSRLSRDEMAEQIITLFQSRQATNSSTASSSTVKTTS